MTSSRPSGQRSSRVCKGNAPGFSVSRPVSRPESSPVPDRVAVEDRGPGRVAHIVHGGQGQLPDIATHRGQAERLPQLFDLDRQSCHRSSGRSGDPAVLSYALARICA
jgi:hypothetical protein